MPERLLRNLLALVVGMLVVYSVSVVWYVATSPDLRLRCLLTDQDSDVSSIELCGAPETKLVPMPHVGDKLLGINRERTRTFFDFCQRLRDLRSAQILAGGNRQLGEDPNEYKRYRLPGLIQVGQSRMVEVEFHRRNSELSSVWRYINVTSLPMSEIVLTLAWFALQAFVLVMGGIAFWNRPDDRSARMFFLMCGLTMAAFIGGFHWWVIAGSPILNIPFIFSACLVPPVTLHFFLTFPGPRKLLVQSPAATALGLYLPALIAAIAMAGIYLLGWYRNGSVVEDDVLPQVLDLLEWLRQSVAVCIIAGCGYFVAGIATLVWSLKSTNSNPIERDRVKWILWAALFATVPIAYTMQLAIFDRAAFVLGHGRIPMFLASLAFIVVYLLEMGRHRTLSIVLTHGGSYYAVNGVLMLVFGIAIAMTVISPQFLNVSLSLAQRIAVFFLVVCSVVLMLWVRDRVQQVVDRRFSSDKYRLDKALQRINRATGDLVEPESLAEMMLASCHDVLHVERIAIYYARKPEHGLYQLMAVRSAPDVPVEINNADILATLHEGGSLQRVPSASRESMSQAQMILHDLRAELLHPIETDSGIVGFLVLGRKKAGRTFTPEDIAFLNALSQLTAVALQSARMHQHMTRLNEELQLKASRISDQERELKLLRAELSLSRGDADEYHPKISSRAQVADSEFQRDTIKGSSAAILEVLSTVRKVAPTESTVLIRGESGTGKELLARIIHQNSERQHGPLVAVHCAALSPSLLESELFGHVRGAFTSAESDRKGRFEMANGGTIFLDEIGDISSETQIKLLRVLQERCFEPVGSSKTIQVDTRIVTATHQNLEKLISEGKFREDLYYRLNVVSVQLPPLRERQQDMIELAIHFLKQTAERSGRNVARIESDALAALESYHWPGNVRELENVIERAVVMADGETIRLRDLSRAVQQSELVVQPSPILLESTIPTAESNQPAHSQNAPLSRINTTRSAKPEMSARLQETANERQKLASALQQCGGNKAEAARLLGMPRSTLYSKLKKHNL